MQRRSGARLQGAFAPINTVQRPKSIADQVFRTLRSSIVMMRLAPGAALSEQEIAARLAVSRQPVREAFIKLSEVDLVRVVPQRGTFVVKISTKAVTDARFVREAVECAIARRAAETLTPDGVGILKAVIAEQRAAMKAGDLERFFILDEAFHRGLAHATGCTYAWKVVEQAKAQMDRVRFLSVPDATPVDRLIMQHQAILDAIAGRRVDAADKAMKAHLREILRSLPRLARAFPDMFEAESDDAGETHPANDKTTAPKPRKKTAR